MNVSATFTIFTEISPTPSRLIQPVREDIIMSTHQIKWKMAAFLGLTKKFFYYRIMSNVRTNYKEIIVMTIKFDMHCHSNYSDGNCTIEQIEKFCIKNNLGIALTDHNEIRGSVRLVERGNIFLIPGMEVSLKGGLELLIYFKHVEEMELFYRKQIEPFKKKCLIAYLENDLFHILETASDFNTYTSIPHPYSIIQILARKKLMRNSPQLIEYLFSKIDAIEVFNGNLSMKQNQNAQKLRERYAKGQTIGSDAHDLKYFGFTNTLIQTTGLSYKDFFEALKHNNYKSIQYVENKLRFIPIYKSMKTNIMHYFKCKIRTKFIRV